MKIRSIFSAFPLKAILCIICITIGLAAFTKCNAQYVVGKWNRVSGKQFFTAEAAKTLGKSFIEVPMASAGSSVIEFKADHTYIKTLSGKYQPKPITLTGTWSVSGNQFEMKMDANQPDRKNNPIKDVALTINKISISGDTIIVSIPLSGNNPMTSKISKIEESYKKM